MLFLLTSWILLAAASAAIGSGVLAIAGGSIFSNFGDRIIAAMWLGLLTTAAILLGLSIFLPLSPAVGFGLLAILTVAALSARAVRRDFGVLCQQLTGPALLGLGVVVLIAALNSTRWVEVYDTGLYHYPLTRWLSTYGTIRGLALIHFRFGFSSSWFALAAPFDFGPFQGRISAVLDGFAILLCLVHFALAISRILAGRADRADWFLAGGYPLIFLVCFSWAFEVSLSPDVPVWILTLLVGWLMLVAGRRQEVVGSQPDSGRGPLLPLLIAVGTITLKPSAAPIVVVAAIFYWFTSSTKVGTRLLSGIVAGLIAVPMLLANTTSSGCPLYPNSLLCLDVPWGVGKTAARTITADIGDWGRVREAASNGPTAWSWIVPWFSQPDKLVLVLLCGVCLTGFVLARGWRGDRPALYVLGLALFGTAFLFATAPNPRFGTGYFSVYPALLFAAVGPKLEVGLRRRRPGGFQNAFVYVLVAIAMLVALQGSVRDRMLRHEIDGLSDSSIAKNESLSNRLLLPPALASSAGDLFIMKNRRIHRLARLEFDTESSNGVEYRSPKDRDQCWGAALPCVPLPPEGDVRLRSPENGFRSGFIHSSDLSNLSSR
jgi:hypothetical protein